MANIVLTNSTIWIAGIDMTAYLNKVGLSETAAELPADTFATAASGWKTRQAGLRDVSIKEEGLWDSPADLAEFSQLGTINQAITVSAEGAETKTAYLLQAGKFHYQPFGKLGEMTPFTVSGTGTNSAAGLVRAQVASASRTISGTGQIGSILTIAGPSSSQFVYATVHIFTAGTTVTIQVQSAPTIGFAGPTTRATIGPLTTSGGTFMTRVAGPFTDGFWRFNCSAITGSFTLAGGIGIQ